MSEHNEEVEMKNNWESTIPWYMTIMSTVALVALAAFLTLNIEWFKEQALLSSAWSNDVFQLHIHHIHSSMIKRSVGLFSGFSSLFIGMAVCFYSLKQQSKVDLKTAGISMAVASSSPGIIAMLLGGYLIVTTVESKDHFAGYTSEAQTSVKQIIKPKTKFKKDSQ